MEKFSSIKDTLEHKQLVSHYMNLLIKELIDRAEKHDQSKMEKAYLFIADVADTIYCGNKTRGD